MIATPATQEVQRRVNRWKFLGLISIFFASIAILLAVENLFLSSLIAFIISYSVGPIVSHFERQGVSRLNATAGTFTFFGAIIGLFVFLVFPYLSDTLAGLQAEAPNYISGLTKFLNNLEAEVRHLAGPYGNFDLTEKVQTRLTYWTTNFFEHLPRFLTQLLTVMALAPFLAFFMVKDGRVIFRNLLNLAPNHLFETVLSLQHQINMQLGQFIRARLLEAVVVGLVTTIGLALLSFPYFILLGIIAAVTNLIPYLGPIIGVLPALFLATATGMTSLQIFLVLMVYFIAQLIDAAILIPLVVAKLVDLHPVTVIVVIIAGAQMMGVLGMIISIPVASTLKVTIGTIYRHLTDSRV